MTMFGHEVETFENLGKDSRIIEWPIVDSGDVQDVSAVSDVRRWPRPAREGFETITETVDR
ncbi:hypothetical protein [Streptomyces sp. NPDC101237]|uniref:hypothetical protein n=1 Tax=Streptomyces sp. NPDC101237 TaxID=3366139 RepID=UPI0037FC18DD